MIIIFSIFATQSDINSIKEKEIKPLEQPKSKQDSEEKNMVIENKTQKQYIYWEEISEKLTVKNPLFIDKNDPYELELNLPFEKIKDINIEICWKDDHKRRFFNLGQDEIFFTLKDNNEKIIDSQSSYNDITIQHEFNSFTSPDIMLINDSEKPQNKINNFFNEQYMNKSLTIRIEIRIGEINPLLKIFDKGNNVDLYINYTYYTPEILNDIDKAPETRILNNPEKRIYNNYFEFKVNATDDSTKNKDIYYSYKLVNYSNWSEWNKKNIINFQNVPNGKYDFYVRSMDKRKNVDETPCIYSFEILPDDTEPPETFILSKFDSIVNKNNVIISWIAEDNTAKTNDLCYSYILEGYENNWSDWTYNSSVNYSNLKDGKYTFKVKSKDIHENIDNTPAEIELIINTSRKDNSPPITTFISGPMGVIDKKQVEFKWSASDDTTPTNEIMYSYKLEGYDIDWSIWTRKTIVSYNDLENNEYIFKVKAKDNNNNIETSIAERLFTVNFIEISRYATRIVELNIGENQHSYYTDPNKTLGGPFGEGDNEGSIDVLSLGINGNITLGFDVQITDKPGYDFIVFENPFYLNNIPDKIYAELMYVEVSTDNIHYARFPSISKSTEPGSIYQNDVKNLAGINPVYANIDKNNIDPFDTKKAGGDAFDLSDLNDHHLVKEKLVDLNNINYIRLLDIRGDGTSLDSIGNPIYDAIDMDNGADLDSIAIIHYKDKSR